MIPRGRNAVRLLGVLPSSLSFHGSYAFPQEQGTRDSSISQHRYFNSYFLLFAFSLSQSFFPLFALYPSFFPLFPLISPFLSSAFVSFRKKKKTLVSFSPHRIIEFIPCKRPCSLSCHVESFQFELILFATDVCLQMSVPLLA